MGRTRYFSTIGIAAGIVVLWLGGSVLLWPIAAVDPSERNPDPKTGMAVFRAKRCDRCHAVAGEGGRIGPELTRAASGGDAMELAAAMLSHGPRMWQRMSLQQIAPPKFDADEMDDLFAFLAMAASLNQAGDPKAGQQIFQSKQCVVCHSIRGKGGKVGPDLATVGSSRNPVGWIAAMWNHAPGMVKAMTAKGIDFPRFQGSEMLDLQSYIRSMAVPNSRSSVRYVRPPSADLGQALFRTKQCIQCHSVAGVGGKVGPDLTQASLVHKYGAVATAMWNHAPEMRRMMDTLKISHPHIEVDEMPDLLAYLSSLSMKRPGDPVAGAAAFRAKGCVSCHPVVAGATGIGPNLTALQDTPTPISIARNMWNHGPAMFQRMGKSSIFWPAFNSKELSDLLAYLKGMQKRTQATR